MRNAMALGVSPFAPQKMGHPAAKLAYRNALNEALKTVRPGYRERE